MHLVSKRSRFNFSTKRSKHWTQLLYMPSVGYSFAIGNILYFYKGHAYVFIAWETHWIILGDNLLKHQSLHAKKPSTNNKHQPPLPPFVLNLCKQSILFSPRLASGCLSRGISSDVLSPPLFSYWGRLQVSLTSPWLQNIFDIYLTGRQAQL